MIINISSTSLRKIDIILVTPSKPSPIFHGEGFGGNQSKEQLNSFVCLAAPEND